MMVIPKARLSPSLAAPFPPNILTVQPRARAIVAIISANVLWGGSAVASKLALGHLAPLTMAGLRVALALIVLHLLLARTHEKPATGVLPALLGLTGVALFCACQNLGLIFADATTTALLGGAIPVLTAGLAAPILGERLGTVRLIGLIISMLGVSAVVLLGSGHGVGKVAFGNLLPMASAISFGFYAVLGRRAFRQRSALAVVTGSTRYGLIFLLPLLSIEMMRHNLQPVTSLDILLLLYLGVGCSALAFLLNGYGLTHLEAGHGAVYGNLKPLVGVALAVVLLGEHLTFHQVAGGALVLIGVAVASSQVTKLVFPCSTVPPLPRRQQRAPSA